MSSSKTVPIAKDINSVNDPHYRYKRSIIETKFINSKGGLTEIINFRSICSQLKVPYPDFSRAYFKAVQKKGNSMVSEGIFKGSLNANSLDKILQKMIVKYILCPKCSYPEWDWNNKICKACGHQGGSTTSSSSYQTSSVVSVSANDKISDTLVQLMHTLYDKRLQLKEKGVDVSTTDTLIDKLWNIIESGEPIKNKHIRCIQEHLNKLN